MDLHSFLLDGPPLPGKAAGHLCMVALDDAALPNIARWLEESRQDAFGMDPEPISDSYSINIVFTDRAQRGQGYAGSIVSAICAQKLPMFKSIVLCADAKSSYSAGNVYQRVGFRKAGVHAARCFFHNHQGP